MKTIKLQKRNGRAFKVRETGNVPVVVYGCGLNFDDLMVNAHEITQVINHTGILYKSTVFNLDIDGKIYTAILKDTCLHAVSGEYSHLDFQIVNENTEFVTEVPVVIEKADICEALKARAMLVVPNKYVKVYNRLSNFVDSIKVDVSQLAKGEIIHSSKFPNVKFVNKHTFPLVSIR